MNCLRWLVALVVIATTNSLLAQTPASELTKEAAEFRAHVDWLANPFMKGRMPGTPEMEFARQYVQWHFENLGLEPAFGGDSSESLAAGANTFRQPFAFGQLRELGATSVTIAGLELAADSDYRAMLAGADGAVTAPLVFAGYGIRNIRNDYQGMADDDDFSDKIVVIYNYAPMDENGKSRFGTTPRGDWPREASNFYKASNIRRRNAAGVILVLPPGLSEADVDLEDMRDRSHQLWQSPVVALTAETFDRILAAGSTGETAMSLRKKADEGRTILDLGAEASLKIEIATTPKMAENVGALLRGRGKLANEVVLVGAHIDHLGLGGMGSRAGPEGRGKVHPGADDNASGTAAIIMMAEDMVAHYQAQPESADLRSVLFVGFDAEEQGLIGSKFYVEKPITALENHAVMVNFDMIGRITDRQLKVDGADSGVGLAAIVRPLFDDSGLVIKEGSSVMMASDHAPFYAAKVPVLFGIITPFHDEYHTPADTADKMNGEDAVRVIHLFNNVVKKVAAHPKRFPFQRVEQAREGSN